MAVLVFILLKPCLNEQLAFIRQRNPMRTLGNAMPARKGMVEHLNEPSGNQSGELKCAIHRIYISVVRIELVQEQGNRSAEPALARMVAWPLDRL